MPATTSVLKKPVNHSLSDDLVRESRSCCGNLSAKVEEMLQACVAAEQLARDAHRQQAQQAVSHWNALHGAAGSYADDHSTL